MNDPDHQAFLKSLELARAALYARDPKHKAMAEIERQMAGQNTGSPGPDSGS